MEMVYDGIMSFVEFFQWFVKMSFVVAFFATALIIVVHYGSAAIKRGRPTVTWLVPMLCSGFILFIGTIAYLWSALQ